MDTMKGEAVDPPEAMGLGSDSESALEKTDVLQVVCPSALLAEGLVVSADPSISSKISS